MSLSRIKSALRLIAAQGPVRGLTTVLGKVRERYHERRLGIDTFAVYSSESLGVDDHQCHVYGTLPYLVVRRMLCHPAVGHHGNVLCDFGSGLGRIAILAAEFPFNRVIGVELIPQLHQRATENLDRARPKLTCRDVVLVNSDATQFTVPGDVTVAFFNNPFHGEVLRKVLSNLAESIRQTPRRVVILAQVPLPGPSGFEHGVAEHPWIHQIDKFLLCEGSAAVIYQITPPH